ncbi:MAG: hypothetical protein V4594_17820 [Bacteroidota bacterium]
MKGNIKLLALLSLFAACKPIELKQLDLMRRDIVVQQDEQTIRAQVQSEDQVGQPKLAYTYYWFEKGRIGNTQGAHSGKLLHGTYAVYDRSSKQPLESGTFDKGLKNGRWLSWNTSGVLKECHNYRHGLLNGPLIRYDSLGKPVDTVKYRNGTILVAKIRKDSTGWVYKIKRLFKKKK